MMRALIYQRLPVWLERRSRLDGRFIAIVLVLLCLAAVGAAQSTGRSAAMWRWLGVRQPLTPAFADMRGVAACWESWRHGYDPLFQNPCDAWGRPSTYPRLWLAPARLGLGQQHTVALAVLAVAAYYIGSFLLLGRLNQTEGLLCGLALCSPAAMTAVERANSDLVIVALLALAVLALGSGGPLTPALSPSDGEKASRKPPTSDPLLPLRGGEGRREGGARWSCRPLAYSLILLAAMLKLYPIAALLAAVRERKRSALLVIGVFGLAFYAYVLAILPDLMQIGKRAVPAKFEGFGCLMLANKISDSLQFRGMDAGAWLKVLGMALAMAVTLVAARSGLKIRSQPAGSSRAMDGFRIAALLYVGSFFLGNNFPYRLIVMVFCFPQLFGWIKNDPARRPTAALALLSILAAMWEPWVIANGFSLTQLKQAAMVANEVVTWVAFAILVKLFCSTLPDWLLLARPPATAQSTRA